MTITTTVFFYSVRADGVAVKEAQMQISGASYAEIKTQCDQIASDVGGWQYRFDWEDG